MVTTHSVAAMEERVDSLERQMAEFRAEQGHFMEAMLKRMDELIVRQHRVEIDGDEGTSRIDDQGDERTQDPLPHKSDFNRSIEIPPFDGTDVRGWLVRIDRYFRVSSIPVGEKLEYAVLALHGEALTWFEWWESQSTFHT